MDWLDEETELACRIRENPPSHQGLTTIEKLGCLLFGGWCLVAALLVGALAKWVLS